VPISLKRYDQLSRANVRWTRHHAASPRCARVQMHRQTLSSYTNLEPDPSSTARKTRPQSARVIVRRESLLARRRIFAASKRALRRAWRDTENAQVRKNPEGNVGYVGTAIDNHPCLRVCPVINDQNCGRGCHPSHPHLAAEADLHRGAQSHSAKVPSADLSKCSTLREQSLDAIHDYLDRHNANPKPFMQGPASESRQGRKARDVGQPAQRALWGFGWRPWCSAGSWR
jgi:hypothetical protein